MRRALAIAAAANILVLAAFMWSHGGGVTAIRVHASAQSFSASVDGRKYGPVAYSVPAAGGVGLALPPSDGIPSLPRTRVESFRVLDAITGAVLADGSRQPGRLRGWRASGDWMTAGATFWAPNGGMITTGYRPWRNYDVEARVASLVSAQVYLRLQADGTGVGFALRPFRDFDSAFFLWRGAAPERAQTSGTVETDPAQTSKTILATALRPYPTLLIAAPLAAVLAVALGLALGVRGRFVFDGTRRLRAASHVVAPGLALGAFGVLLTIGWVYGERVPHVPDEVAYLFQAKIFASFHLWTAVPSAGDHFSFYGAMIQDNGRWFSQYPFGHPLVLAVGEVANVPWLVPPVVGALTANCVYLLGKRLYGALTGLLAAILLVASPFFQMTASNFMSHNTAALALVAATLFLFAPGSHPYRSGFVSGVLLGLVLNIRPLTAAALFVPFVGWHVLELRCASRRRAAALRAGWWGGGFAAMVVAFLVYDRLLTGSFLKTPYSYTTLSRDTLGFLGDHSLAAGLQNVETNIALLVLVLHGWPLFVGLLLAGMPFLMGTRARADWFLLAGVLAIVAAWATYRGVFVMHGPRFWYEAVPYLMLLSARGVQRFVEVVAAGGAGLARWLPSNGASARSGGIVVCVVCVSALLAYSLDGWTLGRHEAFPSIQFVPRTLSELHGFNDADDRLAQVAAAKGIHHALVFVRDCTHWQCFGSVFWRNSPRLDGDIVWARDLGAARNEALLQSFPARRAFLADYSQSAITPLDVP